MAGEELVVKIIGDASKLANEFDKAGNQISKFGDKIKGIGKIATGIGTAVSGALTGIIVKTAEAGDQFDKMSKRTGIAVEDLSSLAYAADICGTDITTVENSFRFLARAMDDTSQGVGQSKEAFEKLGISVVDTEGNLRPTLEVMREAASAIADMTNETEQVAVATDIFGSRYGTQLLPLLKEGGEGIEELMNRAKELGITMSTEAAVKAAEFNDRMTDLKGSLAGAGRSIGDTLIPAIIPLIERVTEIVVKISNWAKENTELTNKIFKWSAALGAVLAVIGPIAVILPSLITGVSLLSSAFLPFTAGSAIIIGIKKLSEYIKATREETYKLKIGLAEMSLEEIDKEIENLAIRANELQLAMSEIDWGTEDAIIATVKHKEYAEELAEINDKLCILYEAREKLTKAEEKGIDVTEEKIRLEEETKKLMEELAEKETEQRKAIEAKMKAAELANAQTEIENKIFALTHTSMEVAIRDLNNLKQAYLDKGIAQEVVNKWYELEINRLKELNEEQKKHVGIMGEVARITKAVTNKIYELTHEPYEVKIKEINEKYDEYIAKVKEAKLSTEEEIIAIKNINIARDLEIKNVDKLTEAEKKNIEKKDKLKNTYKAIKDRIYELTHTAMEIHIRKLKEQKQAYIDLGVAIEDVNEWYDLEIKKLNEVGDAFISLEEIVRPAISKITGYITDNLGTAIYNLWSDLDDYEWSWDSFWEGLWNTVKRTVSNIIAKLLVLVPLLAAVAFFTGGLDWYKIQAVLSFAGISFNKGGGVGYEKGGKVKGFASGGGTDTVPAMLTPGEYVISKPMVEAIKKFRMIPINLVDAITKGLPTPTPAFATGGLVSNVNTDSMGLGANINVYITGNKISDDIDIKKLANTVGNEIIRRLNIRRRY